jgi:hypothetical protein
LKPLRALILAICRLHIAGFMEVGMVNLQVFVEAVAKPTVAVVIDSPSKVFVELVNRQLNQVEPTIRQANNVVVELRFHGNENHVHQASP